MATTSEAFFEAIDQGDVARVRAMLSDDPSLASAQDPSGVSALLRARYRFDHALVAAIRERVRELDVAEAAALGDLDRLTSLLGADPSLVATRTPDGFTLLHLAAFFAGTDAVELLLARGAEVDARGTGWMTGTALHSAASASDPASVRALLAAGADPNARQSTGYTPLHSAAHNGDAESVRALLAADADPSLTTDDGRDAASYAEESGDAGTIALIAGRDP